MTYLYQQKVYGLGLFLLVAPVVTACGGSETTTTEATGSETESDTSSETAGPPACVGNLGAGDLVITEVMSNPSGSDDGFEWFEIHNPGSEALALEGLNIVLSRSDGSSEKQHAMVTDIEIAPGGYVTAGNLADASKLVFIDYGYADILGDMSNGAGWLRINCGDTEVDSVTWLTDREGASHTFDGYLPPDSVDNDELGLWCDAQTFSEHNLTGDLGTPQFPNDWCPPPAGFCYDGDDLRELDPPGVGDLVITEIMADAEGTDEGQEWFEVYVQRELDLNGTGIARTLEDPIVIAQQAQCARVSAGDYLLFAQADNPEENGGLPLPDYVYKHSKLSLTNSDGSLTVSHSGMVVDTVSYPDSESGRALSLDPDFLDAAQNDTADIAAMDGAWCLALGDYGPGGQGTPRAPNSDCGQCIDAMGNPRDPVLPKPGDLTITEFLANPEGTDGSREWLELYVGDTSVDLMHV
ncbi:MAG: lamin tail domain-containing protein, partial [Nannocystaceae bacterium]